MEYSIIEEAKDFLLSYIKGKDGNEGKGYPWRTDWKFVVRHSYRVAGYGREIINGEGNISQEDNKLIITACILHDIGTFDDRKNHAVVGADIVRDWAAHKSYLEEKIDTRHLANIIENHTKKTGKEKDKATAILKDADLLDEIGAMSMIMVAYGVPANTGDYYERVWKALSEDEWKFLKKKGQKLHTKTGKTIFKQKLKFLKSVRKQFEYELMLNGNAEEIEQ